MSDNEQGQSLVEVLVVVVLAAMMIVSLIAIILASLKNAQFAQNQTQATKIAQDTVDKIRVIRDDNKSTAIINGVTSYCFTQLFDNNTCVGTCYYKLASNTTLVFQPSAVAEDLSGGFSRLIQIHQLPSPSSDTANLIVTITWQDSSGAHSSDLETIITKPNYACI